MKTIKSLIRDILRKDKPEKPQERDAKEEHSEPKNAVEAQNEVINPLNSNNNETENHEMDRDSGMADPADPKISGDFQRPGNESGESEETDRGESQPVESKGEETTADMAVKIREAYEKGLIDGRNSRIEEVYFPKENDGVPVFHGSNRKSTPSTDIFSMAREA